MSHKEEHNDTYNKMNTTVNTKENTEWPSKGGNIMSLLMTTQMEDKEVLGLREFRTNISDIYSRAINNFEEIIAGNVKKAGDNTISIISTEILKTVLNCYKFNPLISKDEATSCYEIIFDEIDVTGFGDSKDEAIVMVVESIIELSKDYFDNLQLYMRIDNMKEKYPYFLRIKHCSTISELLKVLGLENI